MDDKDWALITPNQYSSHHPTSFLKYSCMPIVVQWKQFFSTGAKRDTGQADVINDQ